MEEVRNYKFSMVVGNVAVIDNVAVEMDCSLTMATYILSYL